MTAALNITRGLIVDLFAGGGGASVGIEAALGRPVDIAINHDRVALAVHAANHPHTRHLTADIWDVKPLEATGGQPVALLWASPDCTHFSNAAGGKPRQQNIRSLAWVVVDWAREVRPSVIALENVAEFRSWGPLDAGGRPVNREQGAEFLRWKNELTKVGYVVDYRILDASHYGAPTSRKRLFLIARCDGLPISWPTPTHGAAGLFGLKPPRAAAECIDWSLPCPSIFGRTLKDGRPDDLAENTLWRIAQGIKRFVFDNPRPFIVKVNHGGREDRSESLEAPLSTVTAKSVGHALVAAFLTKHFGGVVGVPLDGRPLDTVTATDHHALTVAQFSPGGRASEVRAFLTKYYGEGCGQSLSEPAHTLTSKEHFGLVTVEGTEYQISDIGMRMLAPHELLAAQFGGFASRYDLSAAKTKKDKVRLIGNSVCPEVAQAVIAANVPREEHRRAA